MTWCVIATLRISLHPQVYINIVWVQIMFNPRNSREIITFHEKRCKYVKHIIKISQSILIMWTKIPVLLALALTLFLKSALRPWFSMKNNSLFKQDVLGQTAYLILPVIFHIKYYKSQKVKLFFITLLSRISLNITVSIPQNINVNKFTTLCTIHQ